MTCILIIFVPVLIMAAFVVYRIDKNGELDRWKNITGILGTLVAAIALLWGAYTFYANYRLQRSLAASNIYQEHMKTSFANPDLAYGKAAPKQPVCTGVNDEAIKNDVIAWEKYRWYVGHAMFSFESILEVSGNDGAWNDTIDGFMKGHKDYIGSVKFPCWRYEKSLQKMVEKKFPWRDCSREEEGFEDNCKFN